MSKLPGNPDAERALIGSVLIRPGLFSALAAEVQTDDMLIPVHREVWDAMLAIDARRLPIDVLPLTDELRARGLLGRLDGGAQFLNDCANSTPTAENAWTYARIIQEHATMRRLIMACGAIAERAHGDVGNPDEFLRESVGEISRLAVRQSAGSESLAETYHRLVSDLELSEKGQLIARIPTGIAKLDKLLGGGMALEHLIVPVGMTSSGKSSWGFQVVFRGAFERRVRGLIFSLEMSRSEVFAKAAASISKVSTELFGSRTPETIGDPRENSDRWKTIVRTGSIVAQLSDLVRVEEYRSIGQICAVSTAWRASNPGPAVIMVDHTQKVLGHRPKGATRQEEVWGVARALKDLAKDLKLPVIAPAQLDNDAVKEKRPPRLGDVRDCKAIEHEADLVLGIHRQGDKVVLFALKHRGGRVGRVTVAWQGAWQGFETPDPAMDRQIADDEPDDA